MLAGLCKTVLTQPVTGPLVVIPTPLLQVSMDQATALTNLLADQRRPNRYINPAVLGTSDIFWLDFAQIVREIPDLVHKVFAGHVNNVRPGCRLNTRQNYWLNRWWSCLGQKGGYQGTVWFGLSYAVIVAKATKVFAESVRDAPDQSYCVRQRELPGLSLHCIPPISCWKAELTEHTSKSLREDER